ncbi:hypothetical protein SLEP1_g1077 [Rubroshorea leprosula]|uniref:Transcription repressor n=1 Tax=Rubroshorea leprosula TaxID=152421 RepID=A0AAV5HIC9_9ROSI|nr:hypothetical protein SLEP1_g1077 [Rubroshorea leprosula]
MPITLGKNLNFCFSKIKRPQNPQSSETSPTAAGGCSHQFPTTTVLTLFRNFNSLYDHTLDSTAKSLTSSRSSSISSKPDKDAESEPDFATVLSSQRFFFTSPGSSNSIIESTPSFASATDPRDHSTNSPVDDGCDENKSLESWSTPTVKDSVAVATFSPDPFMDFRRSMQEMVEARELVDVKANWDYLHELLLCYLSLNSKNTHKYIIGAFADLLVSLMANAGSSRKTELPDGGRSISEQCTYNPV